MPLNAQSIYPAVDPQFIPFPSRRSVVHSTKGIVSSTQPLASQAGIKILEAGGNAADAAVAVAAALNVTEPSSTGIGGDMFCLFYDAASKTVRALNGSGRSGAHATLERMRKELGIAEGESGGIPSSSVHAVTVPGAAAGWVDCVERFGSGKVGMGEVLGPAVELAEGGFPVGELAAGFWRKCEELIKGASPNGAEVLKSDAEAPGRCRAPRAGEIMKTPALAKTFRLLAEHGKKGFYEGEVADAIIKVVTDLGGLLTHDDLKHHCETGTEDTEPIKVKVDIPEMINRSKSAGNEQGPVDLWEHPPNGQGIVPLITLGILQDLIKTGQLKKLSPGDHNSPEYLHALIESLRLAFSDAHHHLADPSHSPLPPLLSPPYLSSRAALFSPTTTATHPPGFPALSRSDTVYLAVTDRHGNAASFINSVYSGFGSGIVPPGTGFALQSRGANFVLRDGHANALAPRKRPYHTIIPAMVTDGATGDLHTVYGVMGGYMQPQGHVQVLMNMLVFGMSPQAALDAPRVCIGAGLPDQGDVMDATVFVEEGMGKRTVEGLMGLGHAVEVVGGYGRGLFGRGQVIRAHWEGEQVVYSAGSDPRGDGAAVPQ
ncbi:gamma-glutamyltranspeptidase family protein [Eremomyces bilateralis CBS 781.70]|uniref:Gamma-glutamyltranspeptidase family protein n=1 Tax=Eremomyces bilateralis CBS 781.70 TaxID=1392243 RepID=A0A6G1GHK0_9PEZI|nr:gamma-glutamyltranspeptidase family protein [Eremomyces bilateralis CBS 781.70]KAF1817575.1 gamma-glutamyltranspeptidase family protein [Eremomyces bilateralis CBS 781.70]